MPDKVILEVKGPVATITNNNPDKRNAFDDEMDARLFDILTELKQPPGGPSRHLARRRGKPGRRVETFPLSARTPRP